MSAVSLSLKADIAAIMSVKADDLPPDAELGVTPAWDSVVHLDIMLFLEERYGIEIDEGSIARFSKLAAILELTNPEISAP